MAENNQQGTGKHPHKSSEEPFPHTKSENEGGERSQRANSGSGSGSQGRSQGKEEESGPSDLKEREYRDKEGNVHHHTRTYEEQHGNNK